MLGRQTAELFEYVEIFVNNFLGLAQGPAHRH